jgi:phosphodiester glycosidase
MRSSRRSCLSWLLIASVLCLLVPVGASLAYYGNRPLPLPVRDELFDGIIYYRRLRLEPRLIMIHVIAIDLNNPNVRLFVTPGDPSADLPLKARTTSQFLDEFSMQVAINGDGFTPWHSTSVDDYYPHVGDPITPNGFAMSNGIGYGSGSKATLYISEGNLVRFNDSSIGAYNAVSGDRMLVADRQPVASLPKDDVPNPRSAVGLDITGNRLILMVVDGRQPLYSLGVTLRELADLMIYYGADIAMNLDGGGSSTLVVKGSDGRPRVLNSPIDNYVPGRERPVGNHLGIYLSP